MLKNTFLPLAVIGLLTIAGNAQAEGLTSETQVSYADLDISGKAGRQVLAKRVENAIQKVCAPVNNVTLNERAALKRCMTETESRVQLQMDRLLVSQEEGSRYAAH